MNTPISSKRDFNISDSSMLQDSRTTLAQFKLDQADFASFDTDFNPTFEKNWKDSITDAENAPTDEQILDAQANLTDAVVLKLKDCGDYFQMAKYKIEKAFPNQEGVWKEFGYDNYEDARQVPERMIVFMNVWHDVASSLKYKATLIAAGFVQADIDAIVTKKQALMDAKTNQELAKNSRPGVTQSRVALMNKVWGYRSKVAKAAKYIYANDFAKYKIYLLPASAESTGIFSIEGTIAEKESKTKLENVKVSYGVTANDVVSDSNGKYGFSKLNKGDYTITFTLAGYRSATKTVTFNGEALLVDVALEKI
jgi:hypothetical protein